MGTKIKKQMVCVGTWSRFEFCAASLVQRPGLGEQLKSHYTLELSECHLHKDSVVLQMPSLRALGTVNMQVPTIKSLGIKRCLITSY